jgi:elongation factor P--(R)-beta-lysine ligase
MEVDTPLLGACGVTDLHIDCVPASVCGQRRFLQSSPEYYMKRLLAAGCGPIYSLGKVFRDEELGKRHHPEFTLLEWYRPGWDEHQLMAEVAALFTWLCGPELPIRHHPYGLLFEESLGVDPHRCELAVLAELARRYCGGDWSGESRATLLDLLFSTAVEPQLPAGLVFVYQYPACMSALARLEQDRDGCWLARRFEVFLNGLELGNGYNELTDAVEQRSRFEADVAGRGALGRRQMTVDETFLAAMEAGMPPSSGVAVGVDRLLMQLLGETDIARVLPFRD